MNPTDAEFREPEVVLWAEYPGGRDRAAVQFDGRTYYFLVQSEDFGQPKLVWVRNVEPAPMVFSEKDAAQNRPPVLPESYCNHPKGLPELDLENCRIYWFPQGLGATLYEGDQLLALIPPLPPAELPGFARDCIHPSAVALPLDDDDHYLSTTHTLKPYWESWATPANWKSWRDQLLKTYQKSWGAPQEVFTTEAESWPPIEAAVFQKEDRYFIATIGMGARAQIGIEKELQNFRDHQQVELAVEITQSQISDPNWLGACVQWMVGLARYPWFHRTCFLPGHTIAVPEELQTIIGMEKAHLSPESVRTPESVRAEKQSHPEICLPAFAGQNVNLIWLSDTPPVS